MLHGQTRSLRRSLGRQWARDLVTAALYWSPAGGPAQFKFVRWRIGPCDPGTIAPTGHCSWVLGETKEVKSVGIFTRLDTSMFIMRTDSGPDLYEYCTSRSTKP
jgi:hypothetical protein